MFGKIGYFDANFDSFIDFQVIQRNSCQIFKGERGKHAKNGDKIIKHLHIFHYYQSNQKESDKSIHSICISI